MGRIYLTLTLTGTNDKWNCQSEETAKRGIRQRNSGQQGATLALTTRSANEINGMLENLMKNGCLTDKRACYTLNSGYPYVGTAT